MLPVTRPTKADRPSTEMWSTPVRSGASVVATVAQSRKMTPMPARASAVRVSASATRRAMVVDSCCWTERTGTSAGGERVGGCARWRRLYGSGAGLRDT